MFNIDKSLGKMLNKTKKVKSTNNTFGNFNINTDIWTKNSPHISIAGRRNNVSVEDVRSEIEKRSEQFNITGHKEMHGVRDGSSIEQGRGRIRGIDYDYELYPSPYGSIPSFEVNVNTPKEKKLFMKEVHKIGWKGNVRSR